MYQTKLCLGTSEHFGVSIEDQIRLWHETGFEAFFTAYDGKATSYRALADALGMTYQSIHAPFAGVARIWHGSQDAADAATDELLACVRDCAEADVPVMVSHAYIGFEPSAGPNEAGVARFRRVVEEAGRLGVKIAFENTEGEEYLAALMTAFADYENVGFCWDTGHEMCYNGGTDLLACYGDRLIATHLNDNLGVRSFDGQITWRDDLHLLPFDGIRDWRTAAARMNAHGYHGILTFELVKVSKPDRHDNDKYARMPLEEYVAEAYARACRFAALKASLMCEQ